MAGRFFVCMLGILLISLVQGDFTCQSDSDCLFTGYHCCKGTIYCCSDGYLCTGTDTCLGIGVIVGPIVGGAVLIISIVLACCIRHRRRQRVLASTAYGQQVHAQQQAYPQGYGKP